MKPELFIGPDISKHNGNVNIKRVRDTGAKRIGVRAGYGKGNIDQKWVVNASAMANLSVEPLIYWFSYALNVDMARAEADYCCDAVEKYWSKAPIAYDLEYDTVNYAAKNGVSIGKSAATQFAVAFLKRVRERGHIPVLYTNKDYMNRMFDIRTISIALDGNIYIWYARYINNLPATEENVPDVWQYTSKGKLDGIDGNVDLNKFYVEFKSVKKPENPTTNTSNIRVSDFQSSANADGYTDFSGKKLVVDGLDGPRTEQVKSRILLKARLTAMGYKTGSKGAVVKWVQRRLNEVVEAGLEDDGLFGGGTRKAVIAFQKKYNLTTDGVVGKDTITALFWN